MKTLASVGPVTFQIFESKSGKFLAMVWDDDSMDCVFQKECENRVEAEIAVADLLLRSLRGQ